MNRWGRWNHMIHPAKCMEFHLHGGPMLYQVRNRYERQNILCGAVVPHEILMGIFFPTPYGIGNYPEANQYILKNYNLLDYRTMKTGSYEEALQTLASVHTRGKYMFEPCNWPYPPDTTGWRTRW